MKISFPFKTINNTRITDPVPTMNSLYDYEDILQKKVTTPLSK